MIESLFAAISELKKAASTLSLTLSPSAPPIYPLLSEFPGPDAISFSLPTLPPPAAPSSPTKEDKKVRGDYSSL